MSHFAHITPTSYVDAVISAEPDFIASLPDASEYIQCSYNTRAGVHYSPTTQAPDSLPALRGNYPAIGDFYDASLDAFIKPAPDNPNDAVINTVNYTWESYWVNLNNGISWCAIPRCASTAISIPLAQKYCNAPSTLAYYEYSDLLPWSGAPTGSAHAVIRDPIDRFCSAFAHGFPVSNNVTVDNFIAWMLNQNPAGLEEHFRPQSLILGSVSSVTYHDITKDLTPLALALGLSSIPMANTSAESNKPILTNEQTTKLMGYYASDIELYRSVIS